MVRYLLLWSCFSLTLFSQIIPAQQELLASVNLLVTDLFRDIISPPDESPIIPVVALNNGVKMPVIAAGTWQYNSTVAEAAVTAALKAGYTHVDTAHDYENQDGVGRALKSYFKNGKKNRQNIFLTTKVPGCGKQGISKESCGEDSAKYIDENLRLLGLDYVDLILVHFTPFYGCGPENCKLIRSQWEAFQNAYYDKKTRAIGVSNFCISCLKCLLNWENTTVVPAVNQFKFHVGMGNDPGGLISFCKKNDIIPEAYSPLGNNEEEIIQGKLTTSIGVEHNKSSVQVALRWIIQNGVTLTTKSTNRHHLSADLDIFDWRLSTSEMQELNKAKRPKGTTSFTCSH